MRPLVYDSDIKLSLGRLRRVLDARPQRILMVVRAWRYGGITKSLDTIVPSVQHLVAPKRSKGVPLGPLDV